MREVVFQMVDGMRVGNRVHVAGRNCGVDLQVGDVFSESSPWRSPDREPVSLRVERILLYDDCINQIGPGLTAELELSGPDVARLVGPVELHGRMTAPLQPIAIIGPGKSQRRPV